MKLYVKLSAILIVAVLLFACTKDNDVTDNDPQDVDIPPAKPPIANAGNDVTVQLPANSFTLTGSGTTTNGKITGYLWSLVSGPNVPVINSPGSATTTVTGFVAGSYIFQFMVIDSAGLTGIDTTSALVNPAITQTLTLQPASNDSERHLWATASVDESTHASELDAGTWTAGGETAYVRGLFKFDLSSIPANATITSAKLTLYSNPTPLNGDLVNANSGTDNSMFIQRVTSNWDPPTTNWNNQPTTTTQNEVSIPHTNQSFLDLVDVDVTNLVADMHNSANYGFGIRLQSEVPYNIRVFCSSTYSDASKHPKLVVTYQ